MGSSFLQYLLLAPSFTNVLNVYAFCNLHDVGGAFQICLQIVEAAGFLGLMGYKRKRQGRSSAFGVIQEEQGFGPGRRRGHHKESG